MLKPRYFFFLLLLFLGEIKHGGLARFASCTLVRFVSQGQVMIGLVSDNFIVSLILSLCRHALCFHPQSTDGKSYSFKFHITISSPFKKKIQSTGGLTDTVFPAIGTNKGFVVYLVFLKTYLVTWFN